MANLTSFEDDTLRGVYSIASIPTLILINQQGEIIGRYRGASDEGSIEDLEKKLKETIKPQLRPAGNLLFYEKIGLFDFMDYLFVYDKLSKATDAQL